MVYWLLVSGWAMRGFFGWFKLKGKCQIGKGKSRNGNSTLTTDCSPSVQLNSRQKNTIMAEKFLEQLLEKQGMDGLPEILTSKLSGSTLNTLLLDVFHRQTSRLKPNDVLQAYAENRFVQPSTADFFTLLNLRNELLREAAQGGFEPLELSPVCPLGSCSSVGLAHQNKILSATRGTEVVADATNVLALESALRRRQQGSSAATVRLCSAHRHLRTQVFAFTGFSPHFDVFCMTSAGRDGGHFRFEEAALREHIGVYAQGIKGIPEVSAVSIELLPQSEAAWRFCQEKAPRFTGGLFPYVLKDPDPTQTNYYRFLRVKLWLTVRGKPFDIGDGGFTDWTSRLLSNRKERFFTSGLGIELLAKLLGGQIPVA